MATQIFINVSVNNLQDSIAFWEKLGYSFNKQFTDENAACLVISDTIYAMLLTPAFMKRFTEKKIIDATQEIEAMFALSMESRDAVDALLAKALEAGATEAHREDLGFMYSRAFEDLDGHVWEPFYMDPAHVRA